MKQVRVLVVYPFLHHYRLGGFKEMDNTTGIEYTFVSGVEGSRDIKTLPLQQSPSTSLRTLKGWPIPLAIQRLSNDIAPRL